MPPILAIALGLQAVIDFVSLHRRVPNFDPLDRYPLDLALHFRQAVKCEDFK